MAAGTPHKPLENDHCDRRWQSVSCAAYLQVGYANKREQVAYASRTNFTINPISNRNTSRMTQQFVALHSSPQQDRQERKDLVIEHETVYTGGDELSAQYLGPNSRIFL